MTASLKFMVMGYLLILSVACAVGNIDTHPYRMGFLQDATIDEASGLAASRRNPAILWTINDSGNQPVLYALSTTGDAMGKIHVEDATNRDWEDLAAFRYGNRAYLAVGTSETMPRAGISALSMSLKNPKCRGEGREKRDRQNRHGGSIFGMRTGPVTANRLPSISPADGSFC